MPNIGYGEYTGNGLLFDPTVSPDYIQIPHHADFDFGTSDFSIFVSFYLNGDTGTVQRLIEKLTTAANFGFAISINTAKQLNFLAWSNTVSGPAAAINIPSFVGYYSFVVIKSTQNISGWKIILEQTEPSISNIGSSSIVTGSINNTHDTWIGAGTDVTDTPRFGFNGIMYNIKIFNTALSVPEAKYLNKYSGLFIPDTAKPYIVEEYNFDQKYGKKLVGTKGHTGNLKNFSNVIQSITNQWVTAHRERIQRYNYNLGNGFKFDGINDFAEIDLTQPSASVLKPAYNEAFSIHIIIDLKSFAMNKTFFDTRDTSSTDGVLFGCDSSATDLVWFQIGGSSGSRIGVYFKLKLGKNHVAITKSTSTDVSGLIIYSDAVPVTYTSTYANNLAAFTWGNVFRIAGSKAAVGREINMTLFDFKMFNKQLTEIEVEELYETDGKNIPSTATSNLILDFDMNQESGSTIVDKTSNGNNAIISNATTSIGAGNQWVNELELSF